VHVEPTSSLSAAPGSRAGEKFVNSKLIERPDDQSPGTSNPPEAHEEAIAEAA
jgi:hypothetical protein